MAGVRFKRLRLLLSDLKSIARGWYFKFARTQMPSHTFTDWNRIAIFATKIKQREGPDRINENRIANMELCCSLLSGLILKPGQIFSLQKMIGDPDHNNGFKDGPMIVRGRLQMSSGGGLCQVSTTLFNAALQADFDILEKYNHSIDIWGSERFIDLGKDAIYVFARRDLKFKNTHSHDAVLHLEVDKEKLELTCRILSPQNLPCSVSVSSQVHEELLHPEHHTVDSSRHRKGWVVLTERKTESPDGKVRTTFHRFERYKAVILPEREQ